MSTMISYATDMVDARNQIRQRNYPRYPILFVDINDRPIAAWSPDGRSSGTISGRRSVRTEWAPSHNPAAWYLLRSYVSDRAEKRNRRVPKGTRR